MRTRDWKRWHRWLAVTVGVQWMLWTLSGAFFAWTSIDSVRGDDRRVTPPPPAFGPDWISPSAIDFEGAGLEPPAGLASLAVVALDGAPHYVVPAGEGSILADARTGRVRPPLDAEEARALALASFDRPAEVRSVERVGAVGAHHEYRGGPLPAWVVQLDDDRRTRVYVAAEEGRVVRHRNRSWRVFDWFWMLHTMDYRGRDDIDNPVLRAASALAPLLVLTGGVLWWRSRGRRRVVDRPGPA